MLATTYISNITHGHGFLSGNVFETVLKWSEAQGEYADSKIT